MFQVDIRGSKRKRNSQRLGMSGERHRNLEHTSVTKAQGGDSHFQP